MRVHDSSWAGGEVGVWATGGRSQVAIQSLPIGSRREITFSGRLPPPVAKSGGAGSDRWSAKPTQLVGGAAVQGGAADSVVLSGCVDASEQAVFFVVRAGGEVEGVAGAGGRAVSEADAPEAVDRH